MCFVYICFNSGFVMFCSLIFVLFLFFTIRYPETESQDKILHLNLDSNVIIEFLHLTTNMRFYFLFGMILKFFFI